MRRPPAVAIGLACTLATIVAVVVASSVSWSGDRPRIAAPAAPAANSAELEPDVPATPAAAVATAPARPGDGKAAQVRDRDFGWPQLFARVVGADRTPIEGATLEAPKSLVLGGDREGQALRLDDSGVVARPDADGIFELGSSIPDAILLATAPGFGPVLFDRGWLGKEHDTPLAIPLAPAATLRARVALVSGPPSRSVTVRLITDAHRATQPRKLPIDRFVDSLAIAQATTAANGEAVLAGLPAGVPFVVELWCDGVLRLRDRDLLTLAEGRETTKEWQLAAGATVLVLAIDEARRPVPNLELQLVEVAERGRAPTPGAPAGDVGRPSLRTDAEGCLELADVAPGKWAVVGGLTFSTLESEGALPSIARFDVAPGAGAVPVTLMVPRGLSISGKVLDPTGHAARAQVQVSGAESGLLPLMSRATDAAGRFALGPFEGASYEVFAVPHEEKFARSESLRVDSARDDVVLQLRAGAVVRPKAVRKLDGESVAAHFTLFAEGESKPLPLRSLPPGRYDLVATTDDGSIGFERTLVVREGAELNSVRVSVVRGAQLVLRSTQPKGERETFQLFAGSFCFAAGVLDGQTRKELVVPAAKIRIARPEGFTAPDVELTLAVGESRELLWPPVKTKKK